MTTPAPSSPPRGPERTRQQLQELDALLQKMLALPIMDGDGAPAATNPSQPISAPTPPRVHPASGPVEPLTAALDRASARTPISNSTPPAAADEPTVKRLVSMPAAPSTSPAPQHVKAPQPLPAPTPDPAPTVKRLTPIALGGKSSSPVPAHVKAPQPLNVPLPAPRPKPAPGRPQLALLSPPVVERKPEPPAEPPATVPIRRPAAPPTQNPGPALRVVSPEPAPPKEEPKRGGPGQAAGDLDPAGFDLSGPGSLDLSPFDGDLGPLDELPVGDGTPPQVIRSKLYGLFKGVNTGFDWTVGWLWPVGRFLTAPGARSFLGWVGLLLLLAAAALSLGGWLGWNW